MLFEWREKEAQLYSKDNVVQGAIVWTPFSDKGINFHNLSLHKNALAESQTYIATTMSPYRRFQYKNWH